MCDLEVCLGVVTFGVQLGSVLGEALEANLLPQELEELFQGGAGHLVVVHLLLSALTRSAVHHPHLHLKAQLEEQRRSRYNISLTVHVRTECNIGAHKSPFLYKFRHAIVHSCKLF